MQRHDVQQVPVSVRLMSSNSKVKAVELLDTNWVLQ